MKKLSQRAALAVAGALGALVLALPGRSSADPYRYGGYQWGSTAPYARQQYYGDGQGWRDWRGIQRERREVEQGRVARRRAEDRRQEALRAMERARCAGGWDAYWHYRRAAAQALSAERGYNEQIAQDKHELREAWQGYSPVYDADGD